MKRLYLAGPIFGEKEDPALWRYLVAKMLSADWQAVNPLDIGVYDPVTSDPKTIVIADLKAVHECQAVLALIDKASFGTAMEIRCAYDWNIPVIGWTRDTVEANAVSPWVRYHCRLVTPSLTLALDFVHDHC